MLAAFLGICGFGPNARSVTLAWNPSTSAGIAGYRVYLGTNSHAYKQTVDAGGSLQASLTGLSNGVAYYFAVTAYDSAGSESDFSTEISYTPGGATNQGSLVFAADSGTTTAPFVISNGLVFQTVQTVATNGGRAVYSFSVTRAGAYVVSAMINAPNTSANSLYVNIDAEPADPQNMWDIPVTTGLMSRTVSWTTGGSPQVFNLAAGNHQLIVRGREPNTQIGTITISPAYGVLQIAKNPNRSIQLTGLGQIGHSYDIQASTNFVNWTTIGVVSTDNSGTFSFTDTAAASFPMRVYRLHDQSVGGTPVRGRLQIARNSDRSILLTGLGQAIGHTYDVQASTNLATWTTIGGVAADLTGMLTFTDPAAATLPSRFYRLRDQALLGVAGL